MKVNEIVGRSSIGKLHTFVIGLLQVFEGLVAIVTLGHFYSAVSMDYLCWCTKRDMMREMKKELEEEQVQILKDIPTTKDLPSIPWNALGREKDEEDN